MTINIIIETDESVNINSNLIENLPLYSMSLYAQDGSIYDSQQLEKVNSYFIFLSLIKPSYIYSMVMLMLENLVVQVRFKITIQ